MNRESEFKEDPPLFVHRDVEYRVVDSAEVDCITDLTLDGPAGTAMATQATLQRFFDEAGVQVGDHVLIVRPVKT